MGRGGGRGGVFYEEEDGRVGRQAGGRPLEVEMDMYIVVRLLLEGHDTEGRYCADGSTEKRMDGVEHGQKACYGMLERERARTGIAIRSCPSVPSSKRPPPVFFLPLVLCFFALFRLGEGGHCNYNGTIPSFGSRPSHPSIHAQCPPFWLFSCTRRISKVGTDDGTKPGTCVQWASVTCARSLSSGEKREACWYGISCANGEKGGGGDITTTATSGLEMMGVDDDETRHTQALANHHHTHTYRLTHSRPVSDTDTR